MKKLFVICGHGNGDPGACSNGLTEAYLVRLLAGKMKSKSADVIVGDVNHNWYAENLITKKASELKNYRVVELHMDSASPSAKGAHVIISGRFSPDSDDKKLASSISKLFPGRSNTIVGRTDLANPNRCANLGINYRLLECGFITNDGDRKRFVDNLDEVAETILRSFGITPNNNIEPDNHGTLYKVQVGAYYEKKNAINMKEKLKSMGFDTCIVTDNGWYKVQTGAFQNRTNATNMLKQLENKGVKGFIKVVR